MRLTLALALCSLAVSATSQPVPEAGAAESPLYVGSDRAPSRVTASAVVQRVADGDVEITQLSTPVSALVPLSRDLALSLRASYVSVEGEGLADLDGFADAQIGLSYRARLGAGSAVASLGANVPAGGAALTAEQAETAFLLGQGFYGFRLPSLGQGFNLTPGLTVAYPVGDVIAVGIGAAYQQRGAFEPRDGSDAVYEPGAETLLTGGLDVRLGSGSAASVDVTYASYGSDTWAGQAYRSGDAVAVTGQVTGALGPHEVRLLGRVRRKAESEVDPEAAALLGPDATVPTRARALASIRLRLGRALRIGLSGQGRYYAESQAFAERALAVVSVAPELRFGRRVSLFGRLGMTIGDVEGFEGGGGLSATF